MRLELSGTTAEGMRSPSPHSLGEIESLIRHLCHLADTQRYKWTFQIRVTCCTLRRIHMLRHPSTHTMQLRQEATSAAYNKYFHLFTVVCLLQWGFSAVMATQQPSLGLDPYDREEDTHRCRYCHMYAHTAACISLWLHPCPFQNPLVLDASLRFRR